MIAAVFWKREIADAVAVVVLEVLERHLVEVDAFAAEAEAAEDGPEVGGGRHAPLAAGGPRGGDEVHEEELRVLVGRERGGPDVGCPWRVGAVDAEPLRGLAAASVDADDGGPEKDARDGAEGMRRVLPGARIEKKLVSR